ncbi:MAG: PKD domain-containing protein, partial [Bacteroidota bacterium]
MKTIGGFNKKSVSISIFHFLISAFLFLGLCNSAFASYPAWGTAQTATHSPYTLTFKVPTSIVDLGKVRTSLNLTTSDINATFWQVVFRVYEYGLFSNTLIYTTTYQYPWFPLPTVIYDAIDFTTGTISATSSQKIFAEADIYDTPTHILYTLKTTSYNATVFSDDSYEPNNTFSAASNLGTGSISLSQLIQANNLDYYKFTASAGFLNYTITVNNFFNVAGNFDLYLYNSAQSLINQSTSTTDQEVISMLLPATGTYYIKVISADGGRGFYDLTVGAGASPVTPVADFSGTPTTINVGQSVAFTDLSTNTPTSWSWTFGDGGTSTTKNPSHTYNTAGTYTVALTATNAAGSNTKTRTNYITVNVLAPVADFSGTPTTINVGQSVSFTDLSTNTPTSWSWTFGDGGTSTTKNPSHTYTTGGSYTVALTASNAGGGNTKTRTNYITVNVLAPVADFSGTPTTINVGQSVAFTDLSTNTPTSWSWNFGDGGTSTTKNPSHTYSTAGSYTVALTASNAGGGNTK